MTVTPRNSQPSALRYVATFLIVALGCPVALVAGEAIGCISASTGFDAECAVDGLFYSPFILVATGVVAGVIVGGWRAMLLMPAAILTGMVLIFIVAWTLGTRPPVGFVEGVIATLWFLVPVTIGYGLGRTAMWIARAVRRG